MIDAEARRELREMERRWVDYLSAPSLGISDCRRELLEFLARHSEREAAESEKPEPLPDTGGQFYACPVCRRVNRIGQPCVDDLRHRARLIYDDLEGIPVVTP